MISPRWRDQRPSKIRQAERHEFDCSQQFVFCLSLAGGVWTSSAHAKLWPLCAVTASVYAADNTLHENCSLCLIKRAAAGTCILICNSSEHCGESKTSTSILQIDERNNVCSERMARCCPIVCPNPPCLNLLPLLHTTLLCNLSLLDGTNGGTSCRNSQISRTEVELNNSSTLSRQ